MKKPKIDLGQVAGIAAGAMVGGGLTWLGWRWLEKRGIDPLHFMKDKVEEGNRMYLDDMEFDQLIPDEIDGVEGIDADEDEDEDEEDEEPPEPRRIKRSEPYKIDEETYYHSEEDEDYQHDALTYYAGDGQITDRNKEILPEEPWKIIGVKAYEELEGMQIGEEIYVRNEATRTDYVISKEEGYLND